MSVRRAARLLPIALSFVVVGCSSSSTPSPAAGQTTAPTAASPSPTPPRETPTAAASGAGSVNAAVCDPPAAAGSFYALSTPTLDRQSIASMCEYRGKVVLVVNVASKCGFTYQYAGLESLFAKYHSKGFEVLGFPCNQFGAQEPGSDSEIRNFCSTTYQVKFPIFSKIEVNGSNQSPIYAWLKSQPKGGGTNIEWNFTKFLIDRKGNEIGRYASDVEPTNAELVAKIEAAISASP